VPNQLTTHLATAEGSVTAAGVLLLVLGGAAIVLGLRRGAPVDVFVGRVVPVFMAAYLVTVFVSLSVFDSLIQIDSRTLSPLYVCVLVLIGVCVAHLSSTRIRVAAYTTVLLIASVSN